MALPPVAADTLVAVSVSIIPAPETSASFGTPCVLAPDTLDGARYMRFGGAGAADAIAAALTATYISASTAAMLTAMISQDQVPEYVAVIRYTSPEVPSDGLEAAIGEGLDVGIFLLNSVTEATINTLATWLSASAARKARYMMVFQTADSSAYGGTRPSALAGCEQLGVIGFYSADDAYLAAAWAGKASGRVLVGQQDAGPVALQARILTVTPTTGLTAANIAALAANSFAVLQPSDHGAGATSRIVVGTKAYDGVTDASSAVSLVYAGRQCRAAALGVWMRHAISGIAFKANASGQAEAEAAIYAVIKPMADAGHFTPVDAAPLGFTITSSIVNSRVVVRVVPYLAGEARGFDVPIVGEEV